MSLKTHRKVTARLLIAHGRSQPWPASQWFNKSHSNAKSCNSIPSFFNSIFIPPPHFKITERYPKASLADVSQYDGIENLEVDVFLNYPHEHTMYTSRLSVQLPVHYTIVFCFHGTENNVHHHLQEGLYFYFLNSSTISLWRAERESKSVECLPSPHFRNTTSRTQKSRMWHGPEVRGDRVGVSLESWMGERYSLGLL